MAGRSFPSGPVLGSVGLVILLGTLTIDRLLFTRSIAEEGPPDFSPPYLIRSAGLALASVLIMVAARQRLCDALPPAVLPRAGPPPTRTGPGADGVGVALVTAAVSGFSVVLLLLDPALLSTLVREDNAVEWASAVLAFVAGGLCLLAAANHHRHRSGSAGAGLIPLLLVVLGSGFLLLGLEEVSWFQRVLNIESPEVFINRNGQKETNLHNLATTSTGNIYYIGAFVLTVLLPGLLADRGLPGRWRRLESLVPGDTVLIGSAVAGGFVYEMWNVSWIQVILYCSIVAIVLAGRRGRPEPAVVVVGATILTSVVFLSLGDRMVRSWDDTEIRELIIPFGLTLYGLQLWRTSPRAAGSIGPTAAG